MSMWTHIAATLDVETYIEDKNIKNTVVEMLSKAPEITGSEGNADVFVNVLSGYNTSTNADCNACKYKESVVILEDGFQCEAEDDFVCPDGEYQTRVVITILGDQRDRREEQTKREYLSFVQFLEKECGFFIRNASVSIID